MKKLTNNITLLNSISSLSLQIATIISGFIIPRLILSTFGSEVNGLVSSLNQFLNYISLLEGGISGVITANLYKPLYDRNIEKVSSIVRTSQLFFKKIGIIFLIYTLILAIIYPLIFKVGFSYVYVFSLTLILSMGLFIQYMFSLTLRLLLNADKKVYIVSFTQILIIILNIILFCILIKIYPQIHFLKFISGLTFLLQPIIYNRIVNKYLNLDKKAPIDNSLLKSRWDGFAINIAAFLHYNTDIVILTYFTDLKVVSVYSVYALVTTGLRQLVCSFSSGISPSLGQLYAKNDLQQLNEKFDMYEFIIFCMTFFLFTIGGILIVPFVMLYTKNITDINYYQPLFGILLILSEAVFCIKEPFVALAYSANKFRDIKKHAYIEAFINLVLSLILVKIYGLIGVAIGTLVAMTYRTLYHVFYLENHIINRTVKKFLKKILLFSLVSIIGVVLFTIIIPIKKLSIFNWGINAIIYSIIYILLLILMSSIFYKKEFIYLKNNIFKLKRNKH